MYDVMGGKGPMTHKVWLGLNINKLWTNMWDLTWQTFFFSSVLNRSVVCKGWLHRKSGDHASLELKDRKGKQTKPNRATAHEKVYL